MSYYAITQVKFAGDRLDRVKLHKVVDADGEGFGLDEGSDVHVSEVANLLKTSNRVFGAVASAPGVYERAQEVRCPGNDDVLLSVSVLGRQDVNLRNLPQY